MENKVVGTPKKRIRRPIEFKPCECDSDKVKRASKPISEMRDAINQVRAKLNIALKTHGDESAIKRLIREAKELL